MKFYKPEQLVLPRVKSPFKAVYIIHVIYMSYFGNKKIISFDEYVPINAKILKSIIGKDYKRYLELLLSKGIIEQSKNYKYRVNEYSKSFRFTEKYRNSKFVKIEVDDDSLISKLKRFLSNQARNCQHSYLMECMNQLDFNVSGAYEYVSKNITDSFKLASYNYYIDSIQDKESYYLRDNNKPNRVYSTITGLPSALRQFLSYNGEKLIEIDIKNCQPFLFNVLIKKYFQEKPYLTNPYLYSNIASILPFDSQSTNSTNIQLRSYVELTSSLNTIPYKDVIDYADLTSTGNYYDYLITRLNYKKPKKEFKKWLFASIYYGYNYYHSKRITAFKELFPTVFSIIQYYKSDDYKNLAIVLQKLEVEIVINRIVPRLKAEGIFALTIHDAFLIPHSQMHGAINIIKKEFEKWIGIIPPLSIKGEEQK